jgi:general secretion pathway protein N
MRRWLLLILLAMAAGIAFLPLRLALALIDAPVSAQEASGTIWSGRLTQARAGALNLGTLDVGLAPLALLTGQAQVDFTRIDSGAAPLSGRIGTGLGGRYVDGVSGTMSGGEIGDLPIENVQLDQFSVRFTGDRCVAASGRVRLSLATSFAGLTLRSAMSGTARCDGDALLLPLVGDSGLDRLNIRLSANGNYVASLGVGGAAALRFDGSL